MVSKQMQLRSALTQAIREFFTNEALYTHELQIQGTLCITADRNAIFVTQITETIQDLCAKEAVPSRPGIACSPTAATLTGPKLEALSCPRVSPQGSQPVCQQNSFVSHGQRSPDGPPGGPSFSPMAHTQRSRPCSPTSMPAKSGSPHPLTCLSTETADSHRADISPKRRCVVKQEVPDPAWDSQDAHQWRSKLLRMLGSRASPPPWPESPGELLNLPPTPGPDGPHSYHNAPHGLVPVPGFSSEQLDALASEVTGAGPPGALQLDEGHGFQFSGSWPGGWLRKPKTKFSASQLQALDQEYRNDPFLSTCANKRAQLARSLGLTEKNIQIWFQNQRRRRRAAVYSRMHHLFPSQRSPEDFHSPPPGQGPELPIPAGSSSLSNGLVPDSPMLSADPENSQLPVRSEASGSKTMSDPPCSRPEQGISQGPLNTSSQDID